jgi:hypothetical protein
MTKERDDDSEIALNVDLSNMGTDRLETLLLRLKEELGRRNGDILFVCPALSDLVEHVKLRPLCEDDLITAQIFISQLAEQRHRLLSFNIKASSILPFFERLVLYEDDNLEVLVYIFNKQMKESYLHDHQTSFISCCLQGSYNHKVHEVFMNDSVKHYIQVRKNCGIYSEEVEERQGADKNVVVQPFEAGQCLYLSANAYHTVERLSEEETEAVVTVVIKDLRSEKQVTTVRYNTDDTSQFPKEQSIPIDDPKQLIQLFQQVLANYAQKFITRLPPLHSVSHPIVETHAMVKNMEAGEQLNMNQKERDNIRELMDVGINAYLWSLKECFKQDTSIVKGRIIGCLSRLGYTAPDMTNRIEFINAMFGLFSSPLHELYLQILGGLSAYDTHVEEHVNEKTLATIRQYFPEFPHWKAKWKDKATFICNYINEPPARSPQSSIITSFCSHARNEEIVQPFYSQAQKWNNQYRKQRTLEVPFELDDFYDLDEQRVIQESLESHHLDEEQRNMKEFYNNLLQQRAQQRVETEVQHDTDEELLVLEDNDNFN